MERPNSSTPKIDDPDTLRKQGVLKAYVTDVKDPYKSGRIQVRIVGLQNKDEIPQKNLPWARVVSPLGGGMDRGSFIPPKLGECVNVMLESGDPERPLIIGGSHSRDNKNFKSLNEDQDGNSISSMFNGQPFSEPSGSTEIMMDVYNDAGEPTRDIVYKSTKGATLMIEEADDKEELVLIDHLGQGIRFTSFMPPDQNSDNQNARKLRKVFDQTNLTPQKFCSEPATITIMDGCWQQLKFSAWEEDSKIEMKAYTDNTKYEMMKNHFILDSGPVKIQALAEDDKITTLSDMLEVTVKTDTKIENGNDTAINNGNDTTLSNGNDMTISNGSNITLTNGAKISITTPEMTIDASTIDINVGTMTINGNIKINGNVDMSGILNVSGEVYANGVALSTHTHGGVESGGDNTSGPN